MAIKKQKTQTEKFGTKKPIEIDPVTLAVLSKRFEIVTTKMANTVLRAGRSGVLSVARDFSSSVVTRNCELLTGAESLPIHHLSGADLMARAMIDLHPNLKRGDAFLHNSHLISFQAMKSRMAKIQVCSKNWNIANLVDNALQISAFVRDYPSSSANRYVSNDVRV